MQDGHAPSVATMRVIKWTSIVIAAEREWTERGKDDGKEEEEDEIQFD